MGEQETIGNSPLPRTRESLAADLRQLGITAGMNLIVHSSLKSLGWVCGGPVTVVQALMDVITPAGTLVMPTHSAGYSDPAEWRDPPVPEVWHQAIRDTMPAFDPDLTPTRQMGAIPELFRTWPEVQRSNHPQLSFAAWGKHKNFVTADHGLSYALGETSPLARLYELDGHILLLGVSYGSNTSFHLAEYRVPGVKSVRCGAPIIENGRRVWKTYEDIDLNTDPFAEIGARLQGTQAVQIGKVGSATCRFMSQRTAVDFAAAWLSQSHNSSP